MGGSNSTETLIRPNPRWVKEQAEGNQPKAEAPAREDLVFETWVSCRERNSGGNSGGNRNLLSGDNLKQYVATMESSRHEDSSAHGEAAAKQSEVFAGLDCGDSSFFVSGDRSKIGLADTGHHSDNKSNSTWWRFPSALMGNGKLYADTHTYETAITSIINGGYNKTLDDGMVGSVEGAGASVCGASVTNTTVQGTRARKRQAHVNLYKTGDTAALVLRHSVGGSRDIVFEAPLDVKGGNNGKFKVDPTAQHRFEIHRGDVVVLGTRGFFGDKVQKHNQNDNSVAQEALRCLKDLAVPMNSLFFPDPNFTPSPKQQRNMRTIFWTDHWQSQRLVDEAIAKIVNMRNSDAGEKKEGEITLVIGRLVSRSMLL